MEHLNRYINDKFRKTKGLPRDWVFTTFTVSLASSGLGEARGFSWVIEAYVVVVKSCLIVLGVIFNITLKRQK